MENNKKANVIAFPVSYEDLERMYLLPYLREKFAQAGFYDKDITRLNIEISHEGENWFFNVLVSGTEVGLGVEEWMRSTYTDLRERTGSLFPPMRGIPVTRHREGNACHLNLHTPESDQCFLKAIKSIDPSFDMENNLRLVRSVACRADVLFLFEERTPATSTELV